jgi:hypothetical protein
MLRSRLVNGLLNPYGPKAVELGLGGLSPGEPPPGPGAPGPDVPFQIKEGRQRSTEAVPSDSGCLAVVLKDQEEQESIYGAWL